MYTLKKYEPQIRIWYKDIDGAIRYVVTYKKNKEALVKTLNTKKFVEIEGVVLRVDLVYKIEDYEVKSPIDEFILGLPPTIRKVVEQRQKDKYQKVGRGFESVDEIKKYLEKKGIKIE